MTESHLASNPLFSFVLRIIGLAFPDGRQYVTMKEGRGNFLLDSTTTPWWKGNGTSYLKNDARVKPTVHIDLTMSIVRFLQMLGCAFLTVVFLNVCRT